MAVLDLCTVAHVKTVHKKFSGSTEDSLLAILVSAVSQQIEEYVGYGLNSEARTQLLNVENGQRIFYLNAAPVASIASVKESSVRDFATEGQYTTLTANDDYTFETRRGRLIIGPNFALYPGMGTLQVVHTGGIASSAADVITNYPSIALACAMQVIHLYHRAPMFGVVSHGGNAGSRTIEEGASLLKAVKEMLQPFMRVSYA